MVEMKLAAAPISWGVCEVPGWGERLTASRVLDEMASLGLGATEIGPIGFLPDDGRMLQVELAGHGLRAVGGFVPLVLHDRSQADGTRLAACRVADRFADAGAEVLVSAAVVDSSWAPRRPLDDDEWRQLVESLSVLDEIAAERGLRHVVHPHVGTVIEDSADIDRLLDASDVRWCLDTGHLAIGGVEPSAFAERAGDRVGHVHLKDVDEAVAAQVRSGGLSLVDGVRRGLFQPLGAGDLAIDQVIRHLQDAGYDGWYVLEQDITIPAGEVPVPGAGPLTAVRESLGYLRLRFSAQTATDGPDEGCQ
jgi:inosose dehydratase